MAAREVIHFPIWAQLGPTLLFLIRIPSELATLFPPDLLHQSRGSRVGAYRRCCLSAGRGERQ